MFFETLKMEIRKISISYSGHERKEAINQEKDVVHQIELIESKSHLTETDLENANKLKDTLQTLRKEKIKGAIIRSKVQWLEEGEKPSKFFASLERRNYINKLISKLRVEDKIIEDPGNILKEIQHFCEKLYSKTIHQPHSREYTIFLNENNIRKLTYDQKMSCEGNITYEEVQEIIKDMKNEKTPGIDGFPVEFYNFLGVDIGQFLVESLQEAFRTGQLSITQKRGIITCIPKGNKPREFLKNWRPISLLNTDYKILTSILAKRMKAVLKHIISNNQKGFLKDRYIEENTRLVYDLIDYCKTNNKEGLLLMIDFEKAFDSVEWGYIKKVLSKYNFGEDFTRWFDIIYNDSQSCVINNGIYSNFFSLGRGCRQGDPLSPYLFILAIEPLANFIQQNENIQGISISNKHIKIGQYADDTFLILNGEEVQVRTAMSVFKDFEKISGLRINIDKTQAVLLGPKRNKECLDLNLKYEPTFKLLGITFTPDLKNMEEINYRDKIIEIEKVIKLYKWRNLTISGRITIIKMFVLPKLIPLIKVLPTPRPQLLEEIKGIINQYVWNYNRPKISHNQLVQNFELGGQKMLDFKEFCKATKITWINKIYNATNDPMWLCIFKKIFNSLPLPLIFEGDTYNLRQSYLQTTNLFWKDVLESWLSYRKNTMIDEICYTAFTCVWSSNYIQNQNLLCRRREFANKGCIYIKDLYNYETKSWMNREDFKTKYDININFFDHLCLMRSIPQTIKQKISEYNITQQKSFGLLVNDVCVQTKCTRYVYRSLIKSLKCPLNSCLKWQESLL